jgi:TolA-binding protein
MLSGCMKNFKIYRNLDTAKGLFDKGVDLYVRGEYKEAIKVFQEVLAKFPNAEKERAWAQYEIGFCYFHRNDFSKAEESFKKVLDEFSLRAPRILAARMLIKIKNGDTLKRSSYVN